MPIVPIAPSKAAPGPDRISRRRPRVQVKLPPALRRPCLRSLAVRTCCGLAGLSHRLDTPMVDSHLMLSTMKINPKIRRTIDPDMSARRPATHPGTSLHLVAVAQTGGLRAGGHSKRNRP